LLRPTDLAISRGNPAKAREKLGWQAQYKMQDIVRMMVEVRQATQ
ncbi:MAG: GDP-mannose 4,6-dehydratase, partial [Xenococcaceae cyanobacterium]